MPERHELPESLREIVTQCLARDPADRPRGAELIRAFTETADGAADSRNAPVAAVDSAPGDHAGVTPAPGWLPGRLTAAIARQSAEILAAEIHATQAAPPVPTAAAPHGQAGIGGHVPGPPSGPPLPRNTVYLGGDSLTARAITDGAERWTKTSRDVSYGTLEKWGPPIAFADTVYATHGLTPRRLKATDGSKVYEAETTSMTGGPLAVQGNSLSAVDDEAADLVTTASSEDGNALWDYGLPEASSPRWLVGDGNRVFVMNDTTLYALPVA